MPKIIALSGSLRRGSYNSALLRTAVELAPPTLQIEVASIREIPLYDGDLEAQGAPPPVAALKQKIAASDGLLIATPEYNYSLPGVLKNAIDWVSRPAKEIPAVFGGRAFAMMGAGGPGGTRQAQAAWLPVLRALMVVPWFGKQLFVPLAAKAFDAEGKLIDDGIRAQLQEFMNGYAAFVAGLRRG